jgi:hypothetical protein
MVETQLGVELLLDLGSVGNFLVRLSAFPNPIYWWMREGPEGHRIGGHAIRNFSVERRGN